MESTRPKKQRREPPPLPPNTKGLRPTGRNVGKLANITDVPMDVFFEIASYLLPIDILQLARASNNLRSMLLSRPSRHVWVAARRNVEPPLPDCPDFLSEPAYAYLVFERFCKMCGVGRAAYVDYAIRVRLCTACWKDNVKRGHQITKEMSLKQDKEALRVVYNLVPKATGDQLKYRDPLLEEVKQKSQDLFYEPEFKEIVGRYLDLRNVGDADKTKQFVQECINLTLNRLNFHRKVFQWSCVIRAGKMVNDANAEQEREDAIKTKLLELGWKPDDWPSHGGRWTYGSSKHPFYDMIYQPRPLTDRIWNTIRPKLVALLEQERLRREIEAFDVLWGPRRQQLKGYYRDFLQKPRVWQQQQILPGLRDAIDFLPCVYALLTSAHPDDPITPQQFSAIEPVIPVEAVGYRDRIYANLVKVWRDYLAESERKKQKGKKKAEPADAGEDIPVALGAQLALLNEPTTVFNCTPANQIHKRFECTMYMSYLGIMEHWRVHHSDARCANTARHGDSDLYRFFLPRLLDAVGLDGKTTTHAELHELITSGRPVCSCGEDPAYAYTGGRVPVHAILDVLVKHIPQVEAYERAQYGHVSQEELSTHHITFVPFG